MKKTLGTLKVAALTVVVATIATAALAQTPFTLENREPSLSVDRYGDIPLGALIRTDERYRMDPLIQGPRGWHYWNRLEDAKPFQNPNLWGDKLPTYFVGQLKMPAGTTFTMRGQFPHARYFKIALYRFERNTFIALGGEDLIGWDIEPDQGSGNPYAVGADRTVDDRNYTVHVITEDPPANSADRAPNTMYAGRQDRSIQIVFRIYVTDEGYDGAGLGSGNSPSAPNPLVTYEAELADGTHLSAEEVVERFGEPIGFPPPPLDVEPWYALINSKDNDPVLDPASAPAREDSKWEVFRGIRYTVLGAFMTPEDKKKIPLQKEMEAGGDPTTVYMMNFLSRKFGPVYVFRAKMPTFPDTYGGAETIGDSQVKYWSVVTAASAPSGELWDGVYDMQVPLDDDGFYTIVVSRPEDRPANATLENGVAWIDWGPGEGLDDPRDRKDWGMLLMRFMVCHPDWENSPSPAANKPGTEEAVMGPFFPKGTYTTKEEFEANGPGSGTARNAEMLMFDEARGMRYCEFLVVKKTGIEVYNSTGLSDCPDELLNELDYEELAHELGALKVQLNGPHFWTMDTVGIGLGRKVSFGGIDARYAATLDPALAAKMSHGTAPYRVFTPKKVQKQIFAEGKPVFELVDPAGHVYVLQAYDEGDSMDTLPKLGDGMEQLPDGWRYRTRILDEELVLDLGPEQTIYAVGDEFHQYYTRIQESE